jgi:hypothetical protein
LEYSLIEFLSFLPVALSPPFVFIFAVQRVACSHGFSLLVPNPSFADSRLRRRSHYGHHTTPQY